MRSFTIYLQVKVTYFLFLLQRWTDLHLDSYIQLKFILFILKLNNTNSLHFLSYSSNFPALSNVFFKKFSIHWVRWPFWCRPGQLLHPLSWFLAVAVLPSLLKFWSADYPHFLGNSLVILQECLFCLGSSSLFLCVRLLVLHLKYSWKLILKSSACPTCDSRNHPGRIWGLHENI